MRFLACALAALGLLAAAPQAVAATIGGLVRAEITVPLCCAGLSLSPAGTAIADGATLSAPITGGLLDDAGALLRADLDGAGVRLAAPGGSSFALDNLSVDLAAGAVSGEYLGELFISGSLALELFGRTRLFTLGALTDRGYALIADEVLGRLLRTVFGVDGVGGLEVGFLTVLPEIEVAPVPVPAALPLFAAALAGLGLLARRRRA